MRKRVNNISGQRLKNKLRIKQKFDLKLVAVCGFFGTALLILLVSTINLTSPENLKADTIEISHVEEQVFVNDKSIAAPIINIQKNNGPNTILIQSIKTIPELPTHPNE